MEPNTIRTFAAPFSGKWHHPHSCHAKGTIIIVTVTTEFHRALASLSKIEAMLMAFYRMNNQLSVNDFLLSKERYLHLTSPQSSPDSHHEKRAAVVCLPVSENDELFLGIYFDSEILATLHDYDPLRTLDDKNLDALCVAVEEISHFHLIVNRAQNKTPVSLVELEWQGEMDKIIIASTLLHQQCRDPHYVALARKIYDTAIITSASSHYWEATKFAAQYWFGQPDIAFATQPPKHLPGVRPFLTAAYHTSWQNKLDLLQPTQLKRVI